MDAKALYQKIAGYCAYQERSLQDVEAKLKAWEVPQELHEQLLHLLIEEGYLSQERFANTYTRGKIFLKKWGKAKVKLYLKHKGVDDAIIQDSLAKIDDSAYFESAQRLALNKRRSLKAGLSELEIKQKVYRYLLSKGFEADLIGRVLALVLGGAED